MWQRVPGQVTCTHYKLQPHKVEELSSPNRTAVPCLLSIAGFHFPYWLRCRSTHWGLDACVSGKGQRLEPRQRLSPPPLVHFSITPHFPKHAARPPGVFIQWDTEEMGHRFHFNRLRRDLGKQIHPGSEVGCFPSMNTQELISVSMQWPAQINREGDVSWVLFFPIVF